MLKDTMYLTWWTRGKRIMACVRNAQGRPHDHIADDATWRSETIHGVVHDLFFHEYPAGPNGRGFVVFQEPQHSDAQVVLAKGALHYERDVVRIQVIRIEEWLEVPESPRVAYFRYSHGDRVIVPEPMGTFDFPTVQPDVLSGGQVKTGETDR